VHHLALVTAETDTYRFQGGLMCAPKILEPVCVTQLRRLYVPISRWVPRTRLLDTRFEETLHTLSVEMCRRIAYGVDRDLVSLLTFTRNIKDVKTIALEDQTRRHTCCRNLNVVPRVVLNKEISIGKKTKYANTNMVCSDIYNCGSKRPRRWGKIGKLGLLVVKPYEGPFPE
jgi:hypothetical protein